MHQKWLWIKDNAQYALAILESGTNGPRMLESWKIYKLDYENIMYDSNEVNID